jgi:hypothetical protein
MVFTSRNHLVKYIYVYIPSLTLDNFTRDFTSVKYNNIFNFIRQSRQHETKRKSEKVPTQISSYGQPIMYTCCSWTESMRLFAAVSSVWGTQVVHIIERCAVIGSVIGACLDILSIFIIIQSYTKVHKCNVKILTRMVYLAIAQFPKNNVARNS